MSRDMTLSTRAGLPVAPDDMWAGGATTTLAMPGMQTAQPQQQPLRRLHRLLRGRYWIAIVLGLIGALAGGFFGFTSQVPVYEADGVLYIEPTIANTMMADKAIPFYQQFIKSQAAMIQTPRVAQQAIKSKEWKDAGGKGSGPDAVAAFLSSLSATYLKDSSLVTVSFQSPDPKLAAAGVNSAISAYIDLQKDMNDADKKARLDSLNKQYQDCQNRQRACLDNIRELASKYGTDDLANIHNNQQLEAIRLEGELAKLKYQRQAVEAAMGAANGASTTQPTISLEDLAKFDPNVSELMKMQLQENAKINELITVYGYGLSAKPVVQAKAELDLTTKSLEIAAEAARQKFRAVLPDLNGTGDMVATAKTLEGFKQREAYFQSQYDIVHKNAMDMGTTQQEINKYRDEIAKLKEDMDSLDSKIKSLEWQRATNGNIKPQFGNEPMAPTIDKRKQFAAVGFAGGGFIPIALMLLIGLLDSRYRYSDDAGGGNSMSGLTLLGILPNLPDRLSDPTQASIAAHCVHQIRTMLQINGQDDRRAFCVTSAASGDGKTSLTLALGLSFAASGSRTLLIDADLVGAGLTARLNMNGPEGILEAMTNRDLLPYVRSTDISDLSILPVGLAQLHHAGIFSPAAVRRLVNEAKKHYEVVLIDTGPILGSIEATPVCASADGVILTVARGQQRPLVEKALEHLKGIGARVAGVVFNRAQAKDFEQSISGISMRSASRSASNGHGHNREGGQFGPIARAVASSVKPTDGADKN